jgi:hypothetical protein
VIYADSRALSGHAWPSRALSHVKIKLSAVAFRPGRHSWLARALVGVSYAVPVESSFLHALELNELSKEGTFRFRPALMINGGSIQMLRFFRALSIFFR